MWDKVRGGRRSRRWARPAAPAPRLALPRCATPIPTEAERLVLSLRGHDDPDCALDRLVARAHQALVAARLGPARITSPRSQGPSWLAAYGPVEEMARSLELPCWTLWVAPRLAPPNPPRRWRGRLTDRALALWRRLHPAPVLRGLALRT